jgi:membrane protease YdiL (CAAX protease family)
MTETTPPNPGDSPDTPRSVLDSPPAASLAGDPLSAVPMPAPAAEQKLFQSPALVYVFLRICIYLVLAYGISFALPLALSSFLQGARSPYAPRLLMTGELIGLTGVVAAAWIMSRLEKRSFGEYGLPRRGAFGKNFWTGVVLGLTEISAVIGVMAAFGAYRFGSIAIHGSTLIRWALLWALFFLIVGFYEEFQFRGYVQFTTAQALGFWPAAILLSLAFGIVHRGNPGESWVGVAGVVVTGLLWCFTLRRTGSLWLAVGMHASFDFGETFLYSVPDSGLVFPGHLSNSTISGPAWLTGGSVGPEGSVFDFVMLVLFFFVIHLLYPPRKSGATQGLRPD